MRGWATLHGVAVLACLLVLSLSSSSKVVGRDTLRASHAPMDLSAIKQADALSALNIQAPEDASNYLRSIAVAIRIDRLPEYDALEGSFARAEYESSQKIDSFASDQSVANAFNLASRELLPPDRVTLGDSDVREFRIALSAFFPNLFPAHGSMRPVSSAILLYLLLNNGGGTESLISGAKARVTDPRAKWSSRLAHGVSTAGQRAYQSAFRIYFQNHSAEELNAFMGRLFQTLQAQ